MDDIKMAAHEVDAIRDEMKQMSRYIYDNPEQGLAEEKACKVQTDILTKYGFSVEPDFCGFPTAYKAVYKGSKPGPTIAMLSEYDALPELGHGCGHNLIALISVGAGIAMRKAADEYGGTIWVIGTPAEETLGAKVEMTKAGAFDEADVVMMSHPAFVDAESPDLTAINSYKFSFYGVPAHAAAAPEMGVNALDAMINFFNLVNALRQQTKPDARIHGIITKGGTAPNIIPDYTEAIFYVRANRCAYLEELSQKVINCAKGAALGTGARLEYDFVDGNFKDVHSNRTLRELNNQQMEKLGLKIMRLGDYVAPGSSDIGDVSYACPSIQNGFDITGGKGYGAHTPEFAKCAGTDEAMERALLYAEGHVLTAIELMKDPSKLAAIKEEHAHISDAPALGF